MGICYKNLSKALKRRTECIKLLDSCVQLELNSESLRVQYIIVIVFYGRSMLSSMFYVLLCATRLS